MITNEIEIQDYIDASGMGERSEAWFDTWATMSEVFPDWVNFEPTLTGNEKMQAAIRYMAELAFQTSDDTIKQAAIRYMAGSNE